MHDASGDRWDAGPCDRMLAVLARRASDELAKARAERAEAREPDQEADLGDREVRGSQERLGALDPAPRQVGAGRLAVGRRECAGEVESGVAGLAGHRVEVQRLARNRDRSGHGLAAARAAGRARSPSSTSSCARARACREQLLAQGRDGPVDPVLVLPAEVEHEDPVDVHPQIEQQQVGRPLPADARAKRRLRRQDLDDGAVTLRAPAFVEVANSGGVGVAARGGSDDSVERGRPRHDLADTLDRVAKSGGHVRLIGHLQIPRRLLGWHRITFAEYREVVCAAEQLALRMEAEVHRLHRDPGGIGDIDHRRSGIAALAKERVRGLRDAQPRRPGAVAPGQFAAGMSLDFGHRGAYATGVHH